MRGNAWRDIPPPPLQSNRKETSHMNEMKLFENPEFGAIRTVEVGGEPWLVGRTWPRRWGTATHGMRSIDTLMTKIKLPSGFTTQPVQKYDYHQ